eukprot:gene1231-2389_t
MAYTAKDEVTLHTALEDVEVRFLYNLPESELVQVDRLFFQIEQAHWFYEDFYSDKYPQLPHFKLKGFAIELFNHCPLLLPIQDRCHMLFDDFNAYRFQIPVFGCIMLSDDMSMVLLVRNWSGNSWGFPKGKINQDEKAFPCAMRETFEETGFNPTPYCREENSLVVHEENRVTKLYIASGIPLNTEFNPQTRKEISKIQFHPLNNLPKRCYGVYPFMPKLKRWIQQRSKCRSKSRSASQSSAPSTPLGPNGNRRSTTESNINTSTSSFNERNADTFGSKTMVEGNRWDVKAMFDANARITGKLYEYDGNPHNFGNTHPKYVDYNNPPLPSSFSLPKSSDSTSTSTIPPIHIALSHPIRAISSKSIFQDIAGQDIILDKKTDIRNTTITLPLSGKRSSSVTARTAFVEETNNRQREIKKRLEDRTSKAFMNENKRNTGKIALRPFVLDTDAIMKALDAVLIATELSVEDLLGDIDT